MAFPAWPPAPGRTDGQRAQLAALDVRQRGDQIAEHHRHLPAQQIVHGRCAALVGDVLGVEAALLLEQFHAQVAKAAGAGAGVVELAAARLGLGDQARQVGHLGQRRGVDDQHDGQVVHHAHRQQIVYRVVAGAFVQVRRQHGGRGEHDEGGAVAWRLDDLLVGDGAGSAGAVFHHHGLAQAVGQRQADDARAGVGWAAGRPGHDELDRLGGPALRAGAASGQQGAGGEQRAPAGQRKSGQ